MGLGVEKADPDIMRYPPRSRKRGLFTTEVLMDIIFYGIVIGGLTLGSFVYVIFVLGQGLIGTGCNVHCTMLIERLPINNT